MKKPFKISLIFILVSSLSTNESKSLNAFIPDFQVNENGVLSVALQTKPSISTDDSGNFIIAWEDNRNGNADIYAQRYASDGTELGSNFMVNDDQGSSQQNGPSISIDDIGNFIRRVLHRSLCKIME